MPVRTLVKWPDPRLKQIAEPVDAIDESTKALAVDLVDTMKAHLGAGLAATQVAIPKSICVVKSNFSFVSPLPSDPLIDDAIVLVNPEVKALGEEKFEWQEGCLSVDGIQESVARYSEVMLKYTDLLGNRHKVKLEGPMAGVIQHETDHLIGKVFIDRLTSAKQKKIRSKILLEKRAAEARRKKEIKKQKLEEKAQAQQEFRPGFRSTSQNKGKVQSKRKKRSKTYGKNKRRKK